mgnify:CR=1 FL=1
MDDRPDKRDGLGRFTKGNAPVSPGRPKVAQDFKRRCGDFMEREGWAILERIARSQKDKDNCRALDLIAAYAYGKPGLQVKISGDDEHPIRTINTIEINRLPKP